MARCIKKHKKITTPEQEEVASFDYFFDGSGRAPRYYQQIAINRTVEAIARGENRVLLVMATGTGRRMQPFRSFIAFGKNGRKKRILFLADRNVLIDQTKRNDFKHFKDRMTVIKRRKLTKRLEIYLALYQGLTNYNEDKDAYREFSRDFFDLVVVDECHRGSASADSAWRAILDYFSSATHIGLTATPRNKRNIKYRIFRRSYLYLYTQTGH